MRILIFGAGVIGSLYAALLAGAGFDVSVYARGSRFRVLETKGLLYSTGNAVQRAEVKLVSCLGEEDCYDFVFLTVRAGQAYHALAELRVNRSPTIVTMINTLDPYEKWERICGKGRILPAFPGAGGGFDGDVLHASLTPRLIQPTTFGEIGGAASPRLKRLASVFKTARIPYQVAPDMHAWQLCHLALVVPIAEAYYAAADPRKTGDDRIMMKKTAVKIKTNLRRLSEAGIKLSPLKMEALRRTPAWILARGLSCAYNSSFGERFMYRHSMRAPEEMRELHDSLARWMAGRGRKNDP